MPSNEALTPLLRQFRVLIAGGSYGGLSAALSLLDLSKGRVARFNYTEGAKAPQYQIPIQITVVDERDGFYHLIGSPKALACDKFASKTWTRFCDIPALKSPNLQIVRGSVNTVDFQNKVAQILDFETQETRQEKYDFFIAGTGLRRVFPTVPQSLKREEFLKEVLSHKEAIRGADDGVVVIGGGAVGVEMAAELKELDPQQKVTLVHSRDRLLSAEPLPDDFAERVVSELREQGVEVILGQRVIDTTAVEEEQGKRTWDLTLANGTKLKAGHIMNAVSKSSPTSSYLPKDALTEEGYVQIHPNLQFAKPVPNADYHFAVGDITQWAGIKRCGGAIHHGHYAGTNIYQLMLAEATKAKPEFMNLVQYPPVMGLALGHTAVSYTPDEGTKHGKELLGSLFGEDMGYSICWNYMKMSEPCQA
ncbi:apoptosis inducing factor [Aspergillus bombycis]|uniref:Apoptosis inducing factor n=1 Tax=Aspergillus bombycis TaxID=109264 RepID=A0A1F8ABV6_9EURO|nr:apoptosis inducing factor [Aspergillus bombycis]OGM49226.1 apoptosis inducing factor [Aspergillus bombycis]